MSKINDLIKKLCPRGVKYESLNKIVSISTGKLNANAMVEDGKYAFFTCDANPFKIDTYAFDGEAILISGNGSQVGHLNYYVGKFNAYQRTYVLMDFSDTIIPKYLFYYLEAYIKKHIDDNSKKGSVPYITLPMLQKFKVPIPPIEIQKELIEIFGKFNELREELNAELEVRIKQYEYWKEKVFNAKSNLLPIGELLEDKGYIRGPFGSALVKADMVEDGVPVYEQQHAIYNSRNFRYYITEEKAKKLDRFSVKKDDLIISCSGTVGKVSIINEYDPCGVINQALLILRLNKNIIIPKYMKYYFDSSSGYNSITANTNKSAQVNIASREAIEKINIPVPTIEEQQKIVNKLEKFEELINDNEIGLPAEIELRRKQYEYYRKKLLSFEELSISE